MERKMVKAEIFGLIFIMIATVFFQNFYELSGKALPGIMFGSVNNSIWETTKTVLFPYLLWSIIDVMCVRVPFHKYVVARTISLYFLGIFYILVCLVFSTFNSESYSMPEFAAAIIAVLAASYLSYRLTLSSLHLERLFMPALFMLLLFIALYCSFTPFPPQNLIFMDRTTGLYGIIPDYLDTGAIVLDTIYQF